MSKPDDELLAAEYALGVLEAKDYAKVSQRIASDSKFARTARRWEDALTSLVGVEETPPPSGLIEAIEDEIGRTALPDSRTVRSGEGEWQETGPGFHCKILWRNEEAKRQTRLVRMDAGARIAVHEHGDYEELYMLEGDLVIGEIELGAGDYHVGFKGSVHPAIFTRRGCLCVLMSAY